jgi:hypothetical protein
MMRATHFRAPCGVRVADIFSSICIACAGKTSYLRVIFPDLRVYDINFFSHKSLAVTRIFFFMVYDKNYHNCSSLCRRAGHQLQFCQKIFLIVHNGTFWNNLSNFSHGRLVTLCPEQQQQSCQKQD